MMSLLQLWASTGYLTNYVTQTSMAHLPKDKFEIVPLAIPTVAEQQAIAAVLSDELYLLNNRIAELPAGTFVGLANLERLTLCHNPGADFPLLLELQRSDTTDLSAPGPATVKVQLAVGAPFDIGVEISARGATLSSSTATITKGTATSDGIVVTKNGNHSGVVWVSLSKVGKTPVQSCYYLTHPSLGGCPRNSWRFPEGGRESWWLPGT